LAYTDTLCYTVGDGTNPGKITKDEIFIRVTDNHALGAAVTGETNQDDPAK